MPRGPPLEDSRGERGEYAVVRHVGHPHRMVKTLVSALRTFPYFRVASRPGRDAPPYGLDRRVPSTWAVFFCGMYFVRLLGRGMSPIFESGMIRGRACMRGRRRLQLDINPCPPKASSQCGRTRCIGLCRRGGLDERRIPSSWASALLKFLTMCSWSPAVARSRLKAH